MPCVLLFTALDMSVTQKYKHASGEVLYISKKYFGLLKLML